MQSLPASKFRLILIAFLSSAALFTPDLLLAKTPKDTGKLICAKGTSLTVRDRCAKGETELTPANFSSLISAPQAQCVAGDAGDKGADGEAGEKGLAGKNGISPSGVLPSGTTITGGFYKTYNAGCEFSPYSTTVIFTLPVKAPTAIAPSKVSISNIGHAQFICGGSIANCLANPNQTSPCSGSIANPTAPPGFACIYLTQADTDKTSNLTTVGNLGQYGFGLKFTKKEGYTSQDISIGGRWAYTAP